MRDAAPFPSRFLRRKSAASDANATPCRRCLRIDPRSADNYATPSRRHRRPGAIIAHIHLLPAPPGDRRTPQRPAPRLDTTAAQRCRPAYASPLRPAATVISINRGPHGPAQSHHPAPPIRFVEHSFERSGDGYGTRARLLLGRRHSTGCHPTKSTLTVPFFGSTDPASGRPTCTFHPNKRTVTLHLSDVRGPYCGFSAATFAGATRPPPHA